MTALVVLVLAQLVAPTPVPMPVVVTPLDAAAGRRHDAHAWQIVTGGA